MNCHEVQQQFKTFSEDLLIESTYQEIREHLDDCRPCQIYADNTGSLSYQLKALGQVVVPSDLVDTILFKWRKRGASLRAENPAVPDAIPSPPAKKTFFLIVFVLAAGMAVGYLLRGTAVRFRTSPAPVIAAKRGSTPAVSAASEDEKTIERIKTAFYGIDSGAEAFLIEDLRDIIDKVRKDPEKVSAVQELRRVLETTGRQYPDLSMLTDLKKIAGAQGVEAGNGVVLRQLEDAVYVADRQMMGDLSGVLNQLKKDPKSLAEWKAVHWHYHLSVSNRSELMQIVRDLGLRVDYESSHFLMLYVPRSRLTEFSRRIAGLSGVLSDFKNDDQNGAARESIQVSFYFLDR